MAQDETPPDVLSSLPRTRPQRRSAKRGPAGGAPAAKPAARKSAVAKPKPKATPNAKAKTAPRSRAAKLAARQAPKRATPRIPPAGFAPPTGDEGRAPSGSELVGTAIQAAGELAQIGLAVGGQALRSALGRLGRT